MPETTLASVLVAPKQFEMRELALPIIGPDAGLLKVQACGVCGSDVHGWQRLEPGPRILGHENVGIVAQIGADASRRWGVKEGDRVALEEYVPCGACKWCRSDDFRFCEQTDFSGPGARLWYGSTPLDVSPALWGGYSQYMYMHPNAVVHRMPSGVPSEHAAAFLPFSNGVEWAYRYGEVGLGKAILVQGPGQQGLACVIAAKEAGAACIIVSGLARDARRLEIARKLGADVTVDIESEDLVARVRDATGGQGVDVVVNVSGGRGAVAQGMAAAGKRCTMVLAAPGSEEISVGSVGRRNLVMKWAHGHSYASVELAIQMIASGKYPLDEISTHTFGLNSVADAIQAVSGEGVPGAIHVSVIPVP
jgi:threonine dehydrogenase-like Zn-dependent dehydrogenase